MVAAAAVATAAHNDPFVRGNHVAETAANERIAAINEVAAAACHHAVIAVNAIRICGTASAADDGTTAARDGIADMPADNVGAGCSLLRPEARQCQRIWRGR